MKDHLDSLVNMMIDNGIMFSDAVNEFEKRFIKQMLEKANGNQCKASQSLGIHRNTLKRKIEVLGLDHRPKPRKRRAR